MITVMSSNAIQSNSRSKNFLISPFADLRPSLFAGFPPLSIRLVMILNKRHPKNRDMKILYVGRFKSGDDTAIAGGKKLISGLQAPLNVNAPGPPGPLPILRLCKIRKI
jgi:hypothetical protein